MASFRYVICKVLGHDWQKFTPTFGNHSMRPIFWCARCGCEKWEHETLGYVITEAKPKRKNRSEMEAADSYQAGIKKSVLVGD